MGGKKGECRRKEERRQYNSGDGGEVKRGIKAREEGREETEDRRDSEEGRQVRIG